MTCALTTTTTWQRTRAALLHEHFCGIRARLTLGVSTLTEEIERMSQLVNGKLLTDPDDDEEEPRYLKGTPASLLRAWGNWKKGGHTADALLHDYKPGCGGKKAMPYELVLEIQRRSTLPTGGRDKHGKAPISQVMQTICSDFARRRPLPGVDYSKFPVGAEFPWSYRTVLRKKPSRPMRALGNRGVVAHKNQSAYVSMNYSKLRKCELYTLDDVRLDILCVDLAGNVIEVRLYIMMEVGSRTIVAYILKPLKAIKEEDVDELVAYSLQTPGFGVGAGYQTHILFEQGSVTCSEPAKQVLESTFVDAGGAPRIVVHWTSMLSGVRWIGSPRDKARGNAAGKAVIESFNRWLHYALLHLPGQRGNHRDNTPANLGYNGADDFAPGTLARECQQLARFEVAVNAKADDKSKRLVLRLGMLRLHELDAAVAEAIQRHNTESGHAYKGHGTHFEEEVQPGVWKRQDEPPAPLELPASRNIHFDQLEAGHDQPAAPAQSSGKREYKLNGADASAPLTSAQKNAVYFGAWNKVQLVNPKLDRFAITRRILGAVPKPVDMTPEQFQKMLEVFAAIVRDAKPAPSDNELF
jgi:hypothetical protein